MSTLQVAALVATFWMGLSLVGVEGLVNPVTPELGNWYYVALGFWLMFPLIYILDFFRFHAAKWLGLSVALVILGIEYSAHWHGLIFPGSPEEISRYYSWFRNLYFFGPFEDRITPDLYYVFLDFVMFAMVWIALKRIAFRTYH